MKQHSFKCLLAAVSALGFCAAAHADFTNTFDTALSSEYSQATWSAAQGGSMYPNAANGGWTLGNGPKADFDDTHRPLIRTLMANGRGHVSFDVILDDSSFNSVAGQWYSINVAANSEIAGWTQIVNLVAGNHSPGDPVVRTNIDLTFAQLGWTSISNGYFQLNFGANSENDTGGNNPVNYYIDNVAIYTGTADSPPVPVGYTNTFTDNGLPPEWSAGIAWASGPATWSGSPGTLQATDTSGNYTAGTPPAPNQPGPRGDFNYGSGRFNLYNIQAIAGSGQGHLSFDLVLDASSFPVTPTYSQFELAYNSPSGGYHSIDDYVDNLYGLWGGSGVYSTNIDFSFSQLGWTNAADGYFQLFPGANSGASQPINFYLDNVTMYVASASSASPFTITSGSFTPGTGFVISGTTTQADGTVCRCLASADLSASRSGWTQIGAAGTVSGGAFSFTDAGASSSTQGAKFYVIVSP